MDRTSCGGNLDNPSTSNADARRTLESWATGVEVFLTNMKYRSITGNSSFRYNDNRQQFTKAQKPDYTTFFIDLWDDENQSVIKSRSSLPNENITGYTFAQIESAIFKRTDFSGVVRELDKLNIEPQSELWALKNYWD